jgi:hypothetical protein
MTIKLNAAFIFAAGDCFELGRQSYNNGDYYHTVLWMTEALERYEEEYNKTTAKSDILEYLAFSTYKQGRCLLPASCWFYAWNSLHP